MKKAAYGVGALLVPILIAACVTVNIYFPAPAMQEAAEQIVNEVWGTALESIEETPRSNQPESNPAGSSGPSSRWSPAGLFVALLDLAVSPAQAADINVSTAAIRTLKERIRDRAGEIQPFLESGAAGIDAGGDIVQRSEEGLNLRDRAQLRRLLQAENADRAALYQEIAQANGHPEWSGQVRDVFAEQWRAQARPGWWLQDARGQWAQK